MSSSSDALARPSIRTTFWAAKFLSPIWVSPVSSAYVATASTDGSPDYASFFSMIGVKSDCTLVNLGAPYTLYAVTALTETSTITLLALAGPTTSFKPKDGHDTHPYYLEPVTSALSASELPVPRPVVPSSTPKPASVYQEPQLAPSPQHIASSVTRPNNVQTPPALPEINIGGSVVSPNSDGGYVVASQTLKPGGQITVSGTHICLVPSATTLVVTGNTEPNQPLPKSTLAVITINGTPIAPNAASEYIVGSQTLTPGGQITVLGTPISLVPSVTATVVAGITKPVQPASQPTLATIKINGTPITPNAASQYLVGSQTLTLGGQITVSGTAVSLDPSAAVPVVAGITTPVQPAVQPTLAAITINDTPIMANSASQYIVGSQTLIPGAPAITVSGTRYSIAPLASYTVVGGTTYQVSPYRATLTICGVVVTPNAVATISWAHKRLCLVVLP